MDEQQLLDLLSTNISLKLRHPHYARTVEVAESCYMVVNGKGDKYKKEITRYRRFEDDTLKEQRVRLNNPITPVFISKPSQLLKKLYRVDGVRRDVSGLSDTDLQSMEDAFWNFQPGKDLETWVIDKVLYLQEVDPNAYILKDRYDVRRPDGNIEITAPRPVVYRSPDVLNMKKDGRGVLEWILFRDIRMEYRVESGMRRQKMLEDFFLYTDSFIVRAREIGEKTEIEKDETEIGIDVYPEDPPDESPAEKIGQSKPAAFPLPQEPIRRQFYVSIIEHGAKEVPAGCVGCFPDAETDQETFVSWFWAGMPVLLNVIRDSQMLDVEIVMEAFRRSWEFAPPCEFETETGAHCGDERKGYIRGENGLHICPSCKGAGIQPNFTTEQIVNRVPLPPGTDEQAKALELAKLSFREPNDTTLLEWFVERLKDHELQFNSCLFGSGQLTQPTGSELKTATEVLEKTSSLADILRPIGLVVSQEWEQWWRVLAAYREYSGELKVNHSYPENIDLLTLQQEIANFAAIQEVDIYESKIHQRHRILAKQFEGEPDTHHRIAARYKFLPFDDKSPEQQVQIISALSLNDSTAILWAYWAQIFQEIEAADPVFYKKKYDAQKAVVDAKVAEFRGRIELAGGGEPEIPDFNATDDDEMEQTESE